MQPATYILASKTDGVLYVGVTSNLLQRVWQHKENLVVGFSQKYNIHLLVHFEIHDSMEQAILREKQIKNWNRQWKIDLITQSNPDWQDLYSSLL